MVRVYTELWQPLQRTQEACHSSRFQPELRLACASAPGATLDKRTRQFLYTDCDVVEVHGELRKPLLRAQLHAVDHDVSQSVASLAPGAQPLSVVLQLPEPPLSLLSVFSLESQKSVTSSYIFCEMSETRLNKSGSKITSR